MAPIRVVVFERCHLLNEGRASRSCVPLAPREGSRWKFWELSSAGVRYSKVFAGFDVSSCSYVAADGLTAELVMICETPSCRRQILLVLHKYAGVPPFQLRLDLVRKILSYPDHPANHRGC